MRSHVGLLHYPTVSDPLLPDLLVNFLCYHKYDLSLTKFLYVLDESLLVVLANTFFKVNRTHLVFLFGYFFYIYYLIKRKRKKKKKRGDTLGLT